MSSGAANDLNDGDEFVWEDEPDAPPPASDHSSSHHYFLDLAAMRARAQYASARDHWKGKRHRGPGGGSAPATVDVEPPEAA